MTRDPGVDVAFEALVAGRWQRLVRAAGLLGCSRAEAEDVVQTTLLRCYTRWHRVAAARDRDAYVHGVLVHTVASSRRRRWWGERPTADLPGWATTDDPTGDVALSRTVRAALSRLPWEQRAVLVLRFYADLSERDTADALGIAPGTVKSRTSRALARLSTDPDLTDDHAFGSRT